MNIILWILAGVLAAMFLMAGLIKTIQPKEKLVEKLPWVEDYSPGTVKFIGIAEFLGSLGLVLPAALGVLPILTPIAASGLAIVMLLAMQVHRRRNESKAMVFNGVLLLAALAVAVGRFGPYSF